MWNRFLSVGLLTSLGGCADLLGADFHVMPQPDAGADAPPEVSRDQDSNETSLVESDGSRPDVKLDVQRDVVDIPPDFECDGTWRDGTDKNCESSRKVYLLENPIANLLPVNLARSSSGLIVIGYPQQSMSDDTGIRLQAFREPKGSADNLGALIHDIGFGLGTHVGPGFALAAHPVGDTFDVAFEDQDQGAVYFRQLAGLNGPLSAKEIVASSIGAGVLMGLATHTDRPTVLVYTRPADKNLVWSSRKLSGGFEERGELEDALVSAVLPRRFDVGYDESGDLHVLYHDLILSEMSRVRYLQYNGASWSNYKTIENQALEGQAGFAPTIASQGNRLFAAYFRYRKSEGRFLGALHLAQWSKDSDEIVVSKLQESIPVSSPADPSEAWPRMDVGIDVDRFGLLHVAAVLPVSNNTSGEVVYWRQGFVAGEARWFRDTIDNAVFGDTLGAPGRASVALVVDEKARPHIAYTKSTEKDSGVYYATRLDR